MKRYSLIVYDCDGTLYPQTPVRAYMALRMAAFALCHPGRLGELALVRDYRARRSRQAGRAFSEQQLFRELARERGLEADEARRIVEHWMQRQPARALRRWADGSLRQLICEQRRAGIRTVVYSDLPLGTKLSALDMEFDGAYSPATVEQAALKPDPAILNEILRREGVGPEQALMVGDSPAKDGECARAAGVDYFCMRGAMGARKKLCGELRRRTGVGT